MNPIADQLMNTFISSGNQFLSGGLVLMLVGAVGVWARRVPKTIWAFLKHHFTTVVDVQSSDFSYDWLLYWLESSNYGKRTRRISVKHITTAGGKRKTVFVPSKGQHWFFHKGRIVWLSRSTESSTATANNPEAALAQKEVITLRVTGRDRNVVEEVINHAKSLYETLDGNFIHLNFWDGWNNWTRRMTSPRTMESVILPEAASNILNDVKRFFDSRDWYIRKGIPHRRGYLFHGLPGTGKSTIVSALAGTLRIPIYLINLASMTDNQLEKAVAAIDKIERSIVLIEDVDTVVPERDADNKKLSLGTLLNVIDGITATDNSILVMTTNDASKLDPALIRKGRVDVSIEFGHATEDQISRAMNLFLENPTEEQQREVAAWPRPLVMSQVQENLKMMCLS